MKKVELYDIVLTVLKEEWTPMQEIRRKMNQIRPGIRNSSVNRVLLKAFDQGRAFREQHNENGHVAYRYRLNPNPPKEIPPRPIRPQGRPRKDRQPEVELPYACKIPRGAVEVTHNARTWRPLDKPILPIRYCKMENGKYYRIHRNGCGYTLVTEAHIKHMAKERTYG